MELKNSSPYKGYGAKCTKCNKPINVSEGLYHCKTDWEDYHIYCVNKTDYDPMKPPMKLGKSGNPFNFAYPKSPKYGPGGFGSKIPFPPPHYTVGLPPPTSSSGLFGPPSTSKLYSSSLYGGGKPGAPLPSITK